MSDYQGYDALVATVRLKDITSSAGNRAILHRMKNNDPALEYLYISSPDNINPDEPNQYVLREGDDLGWLGYFIGENFTLTEMYVHHVPADIGQAREMFKGFERNKTITSVDIDTNVLNEGLSAMNMPHVKSIGFDCQLERDAAHCFALGLRQCKSLKSYFGMLTVEILTVLSTLPMVKNIIAHVDEAGNNTLGREGGVALEQLLRKNKLNHLDLDARFIGDEGLEMMAAGLVHNKSLTECCLSNNNISGEGVKALAVALVDNRSIRALNLGQNNIGDEGLKALASSLTHNQGLRVLNISDNSFGDEGLEALANSLASNRKLRGLHLCNNNIGDTGLLALAVSLAQNRALRVISLSGNTAITEIGLTAMARALQSRKCKLEDLCLDRIHIGDGGKVLARALSINKSLVSLSLTCGGGMVSISDDGLRALTAGLSHNCTLRELDLSENTAITAIGLSHLRQYLWAPSCALESLSIYCINFGDEGAFALVDALTRNKSLKELLFGGVRYAGITVAGWEAFSKLLCDSSSANNMYLSNHTLQTICHSWLWRDNITPWLKANGDSQSQSTAAKYKILKRISDLNMVPFFQWDLKFLPLVKSWFQTVTSCPDMKSSDEWIKLATSIRSRGRELSAMYKFVRGMPVLVAYNYKQYLMQQLRSIRAMKSKLQEEIQGLEERERRLMEA
ncbi:leucine-rich repeat protein [Skeletonema marinoi]|uniref:Leucine-rich repeat protein n=1 Tax=Skeletonema marinoi TaxID=267567 RepID=A0AAD8XV94_9STRA|nr:leucine-rich repeat protein [Skeletonema marinoi]